jgi:hypothetical protein
MEPRLLVEIAVVAGAVPVLGSRPALSPRSAHPSRHLRARPHRAGRQLRLRRQPPRLRPLPASPWLVRSLISTRSADPSWLPARNRALSAPVIVADEDNNRLVISTRRVGRYGSYPTGGSRTRPDLPTS